MSAPLALYLAQKLDDANPDDSGIQLLMYNAADELRKQHAKIKAECMTLDELRGLLRIEFLRHDHLELPWKCVEADCPRFGKSLYLSGCECRLDFERQHTVAVKKELGL